VKLVFHERAWADYLHWQGIDRALLERVNLLIKACSRTPFAGIGKPEPLRGTLAGWKSRRINWEHRLVYRPTKGGLLIAHCRYQY
jgi:toxin YoeB